MNEKINETMDLFKNASKVKDFILTSTEMAHSGNLSDYHLALLQELPAILIAAYGIDVLKLASQLLKEAREEA